MNILYAGSRRWLANCVALLQKGHPVELRVSGWRAKRLARAVSLGAHYRPNFLSLWLMPRLNVVLEAAAQGQYRVTVNPTDSKDVLAFIFQNDGEPQRDT
jgi:hypothetical protein